MKIRRRRSSWIFLIPVSSSLPEASLARDSIWATRSLCAPSKRARLRIASIALKRAVEISHGRGLSGMPVFGHVSNAAAKASCIDSSAQGTDRRKIRGRWTNRTTFTGRKC